MSSYLSDSLPNLGTVLAGMKDIEGSCKHTWAIL